MSKLLVIHSKAHSSGIVNFLVVLIISTSTMICRWLIAVLHVQIFFSAQKNSKNSELQFREQVIHRQRRSLDTEVTIQLLVVVDRDMINYHGNQSIEEYVLTVMNMVSKSTRADLTAKRPDHLEQLFGRLRFSEYYAVIKGTKCQYTDLFVRRVTLSRNEGNP